VLRFLLGAAEAGFFPGVILYLHLLVSGGVSRQDRRHLHGWRFRWRGLIGSPVSRGAILGMDGILGLGGWQWIFLLESGTDAPAGRGGLLVPDRQARSCQVAGTRAAGRG